MSRPTSSSKSVIYFDQSSMSMVNSYINTVVAIHFHAKNNERYDKSYYYVLFGHCCLYLTQHQWRFTLNKTANCSSVYFLSTVMFALSCSQLDILVLNKLHFLSLAVLDSPLPSCTDRRYQKLFEQLHWLIISSETVVSLMMLQLCMWKLSVCYRFSVWHRHCFVLFRNASSCWMFVHLSVQSGADYFSAPVVQAAQVYDPAKAYYAPVAAVAQAPSAAAVYTLPVDATAVYQAAKYPQIYDTTSKTYYPVAAAAAPSVVPTTMYTAVPAEPVYQTRQWFFLHCCFSFFVTIAKKNIVMSMTRVMV